MHQTLDDHAGLSRQIRTTPYVNGLWVDVGESGTIDVDDPATGEIVATVPAMSRAQVRDAIEAAHRALPAWRSRSGKDRCTVLRAWAELVAANAEHLARLIVLEEGKPLAEARGEVAYAGSFIEWFAEEAKRVSGEVLMTPQASGRIVVLKEPVGVCTAITPWNFPAAMITRKAAPALAAGCTMVVKPAEQTPLTAFALAELAAEAGVPPGVLNVVTGHPEEIGPELTTHELVRKISFTGSTQVGRLLLAQAAGTVKRASMELGGNAPILVFDDADIDTALSGVMAAKFRNSGESCIGGNRVYVQAGIYDAFAAALAERAASLIVGPGLETDSHIGPLIDQAAVAKVEAHIADATAGGASILSGGTVDPRGGRFFTPTVLGNVLPGMLVTREETFGPVLPLIRFKSEAEVVAWANDSEYGLAAYVFTRDAERTWRVAGALEAGMVGINTGLISNEIAPFGGIKQSGLGREGSVHGIDEYLELKYVAWENARGVPLPE